MRKLIILTLIIPLIISFAGCGIPKTDNTSQPTQQSRQPNQPQHQEKPQHSPLPLIQATVTRVVDGDTLKVTINGKEETVRLIGVDTPETVKPNSPVEPYGKEASNYTKSTMEGKTIFLEKDVEERDRYGRLLAYAWTTPPAEVSDKEIREKMFNARLLLEGYAQILTVPPNVKYVDRFTGYQKEARKEKRGLWGLSGSKP